MNVFAGERIVESYLPRRGRLCEPLWQLHPARLVAHLGLPASQGRLEDAKAIQRLINRMDHIIAEGHPTYGHQCYSKALWRRPPAIRSATCARR